MISNKSMKNKSNSDSNVQNKQSVKIDYEEFKDVDIQKEAQDILNESIMSK